MAMRYSPCKITSQGIGTRIFCTRNETVRRQDFVRRWVPVQREPIREGHWPCMRLEGTPGHGLVKSLSTDRGELPWEQDASMPFAGNLLYIVRPDPPRASFKSVVEASFRAANEFYMKDAPSVVAEGDT